MSTILIKLTFYRIRRPLAFIRKSQNGTSRVSTPRIWWPLRTYLLHWCATSVHRFACPKMFTLQSSLHKRMAQSWAHSKSSSSTSKCIDRILLEFYMQNWIFPSAENSKNKLHRNTMTSACVANEMLSIRSSIVLPINWPLWRNLWSLSSTSIWTNWTSKWTVWAPISKTVYFYAFWWDCLAASSCHYTISICSPRMPNKWCTMWHFHSNWCKMLDYQSQRHAPKISLTWTWSPHFVCCTICSQNTEMYLERIPNIVRVLYILICTNLKFVFFDIWLTN